MSYYSHLSFEEGEEIYQLRASGHSQDFIARHLGCNSSIISREPSRNRLCSGGYSALLSHGRYLQGRQRQAGLEKNEVAKHYVVSRLIEGWSPEEITSWLKQGNEAGIGSFSFETIYRFIYRSAQKAEKLLKYLVRHHHKRKKRCARVSRDRIKNLSPFTTCPKRSMTDLSLATGKEIWSNASEVVRFRLSMNVKAV